MIFFKNIIGSSIEFSLALSSAIPLYLLFLSTYLLFLSTYSQSQVEMALHYKNNTEEYEDHVLEELRLADEDNDYDNDV